MMIDKHITQGSPGSATNTTEALQKKQHRQFTSELAATVTAGILFAAIVWASLIGMGGGFDQEAITMAEVTDAH